MNPSIATQAFWLGLRSRTSANGKIGKGLCNKWAAEVLAILDNEISEHEMKPYRLDAISLKLLGDIGTHFHEWIELRELGRRFIADGTAGQIDERFLRGYYGPIENVPADSDLKKVYTSRKVKSSMYIPLERRLINYVQV